MYIQEERSRVKEQQDNAYHRMRSLQQQSRGKKDAYYQNRRFSQEVGITPASITCLTSQLPVLGLQSSLHTSMLLKRPSVLVAMQVCLMLH